MTIAFIGLGTMGRRMAAHVVAAGHAVVACDADPARAAALGTAIAATPAEAAGSASVAVLSLPSPAAVEEVVLGRDGVRQGMHPGGTVIDMSTSPPELMRRLAGELAEASLAFLDAPVSGGPHGAETATLAIMVGGDRDVFERHRALLGLMGSRVEHVGAPGAGQTVKLCNNLIVACTMVALGEGCRLLEREGIDAAQAYEVLTSSTSDSTVLRRRFPVPGVRTEHPASHGYEPAFRLDLLVKDLRLALALAEEHGVNAPLGQAAAGAYEAALAGGHAALDYSAVYLTQGILDGVR